MRRWCSPSMNPSQMYRMYSMKDSLHLSCDSSMDRRSLSIRISFISDSGIWAKLPNRFLTELYVVIDILYATTQRVTFGGGSGLEKKIAAKFKTWPLGHLGALDLTPWLLSQTIKYIYKVLTILLSYVTVDTCSTANIHK